MVSGVGPGLGRATAAAVLREGAGVVLGDLDTVRLETIRHELDPDGGHSSAIGLDITQDPDCNAIVEAARNASAVSTAWCTWRRSTRWKAGSWRAASTTGTAPPT